MDTGRGGGREDDTSSSGGTVEGMTSFISSVPASTSKVEGMGAKNFF